VFSYHLPPYLVIPDAPSSANNPPNERTGATKLPRAVAAGIYAFSPNRDTMGATAYFLTEPSGNILVDCPAWNLTHQDFVQQQGGVRWLFVTHRGGIAHVKEIQQSTGCEVVIQEQEAYLLPDVDTTSFHQDFEFSSVSRAIWTPGYSPGSACLYTTVQGGVLFTGRHLLPNQQGEPVPLRIAKTFHWPRQLRSVQQLRDRFSPTTLHLLCPGANTGFLRGQRSIDRAYERLMALDLETYRQMQPGL